VTTYLYPYAQRRFQIHKIPTTYKFAIGSFLGALSIGWALYVEHLIHYTYQTHHAQISILRQTPAYVLIGAGEIFAITAAYEVAFSASSPATKVLSSSINIFCVGGIPNLVCILLFRICEHWFRNTTRGDMNITHLSDYTTANVSRYFLVLIGILVLGIGFNVASPIRDFVDHVEKTVSLELALMTPKISRDHYYYLNKEESEESDESETHGDDQVTFLMQK
jgi:proton-dependent oligopeptide transporter, POT family